MRVGVSTLKSVTRKELYCPFSTLDGAVLIRVTRRDSVQGCVCFTLTRLVS